MSRLLDLGLRAHLGDVSGNKPRYKSRWLTTGLDLHVNPKFPSPRTPFIGHTATSTSSAWGSSSTKGGDCLFALITRGGDRQILFWRKWDSRGLSSSHLKRRGRAWWAFRCPRLDFGDCSSRQHLWRRGRWDGIESGKQGPKKAHGRKEQGANFERSPQVLSFSHSSPSSPSTPY